MTFDEARTLPTRAPGGWAESVARLADRLFRHESGRIRAALIRRFGVRRMDLADDVVQETLLAALRHWRFNGVPQNPAAWLMTVAQRKAIDALRADQRARDLVSRLSEEMSEAAQAEGLRDGVDDTLGLMAMCCHPSLSTADRVLLTLSLVAGFGAAELARAFLISSRAAEQRLTRAKRRLRESGATMAPPEGRLPAATVDALLQTIYLMLNEGHAAHDGDQLIRRDLLEESVRLVAILRRTLPDDAGQRSAVHGLAALAHFTAARLDARCSAVGELVPMEDQDRSRWDRKQIAMGFWHLERSALGERASVYGIEAAIAGCHAAAPSFEQTRWDDVVRLYEVLHTLKPTPLVALNRSVAIAMRDGPAAGLAAIDEIDPGGLAERYHLWTAARGEILLRAERHAEAAESFRKALERPCTVPERALLRRRLASAEARC